MRLKIINLTFAVVITITMIVGTAWAENGIGGTTDFNADAKSRIAAIEGTVEVNQGNIADNAAGISENAARISVNENDIETLMSSGSGVGPGIANTLFQVSATGPYIPGNTTAVIVSGSINAPVDGYVLALGSLQGGGGCSVGISMSNILPPYQDVYSGGGAATVHGIFSVTAGENVFNLLGRNRQDVSSCNYNDVNLSMVFFPASSAYGPVTSN
jgi:hypothetical protein